jgi:hypothetical protein
MCRLLLTSLLIEGGLMKTRNTITKLIALTTTVAALITASLLCGGSLLQPVEAQTSDGSVRFVSYASVGIVHGQKVRISVSNPEESTGNITLSCSYYLANGGNSSSSVPLYESESIRVPPREFRSSEVARKDLKTEGEPRTGRAQVLVKLTIIAPAGSNPDDFPGSLEVIEDEVQGGEPVEIDSKYRLIIIAAKRSEFNAPIAFIPGQRLRYSFFNPNEEGSQPVRVQAYIYDSYGNLLSQTDRVELQPGQFHAFDIYRDDLRVAGEVGTGRLEVRAGIQVVLMDGSVRYVKLPVWMEVVNSTGSTAGGEYFTGSVTVSDDGFGGYN